jgi:hypothetical protein
MDAKALLKRIILIAVAGALPAFASVASAGGGGHSGGSSGGPSSNGSSSGHSSSASNSGHSSKVGHAASDPNTGPAAATGGRSVLVSSVRPSTFQSRLVPVTEVHQFSTGYVPNEQWRDYWRRKHHWFFF